MAREIVQVEFIGLEDAYAGPFAQSIRRIVCDHQSDYYRFVEWREQRDTGSRPDIGIIAVASGQSWPEVRVNVNRCHTSNIGLLGAERPMLGLPVIRLLRDITELAHGALYPDEPDTVPGSVGTLPGSARALSLSC